MLGVLGELTVLSSSFCGSSWSRNNRTVLPMPLLLHVPFLSLLMLCWLVWALADTLQGVLHPGTSAFLVSQGLPSWSSVHHPPSETSHFKCAILTAFIPNNLSWVLSTFVLFIVSYTSQFMTSECPKQFVYSLNLRILVDSLPFLSLVSLPHFLTYLSEVCPLKCT